MTEQVAPPRAGTWGDLLSREHLGAAATLAGGVVLYALNVYLTAAVLPSVVDDIGGQQYYAWVSTAFLTASVIASMMVSRLLARRSPSQAYLLAFFLFGAGSLVAALAPQMWVLVAGRVVQGLGGGLLAGLGFAVIRGALPERLWTRATGLVSAMWGVGNLIGPALGGTFAGLGWWRQVFGVLAAVALVLGFLSTRSLPHTATGAGGEVARLPVRSLALVSLAATVLSVAAATERHGLALVTALAGVLLLVVFASTDGRRPSSVLPHPTYRRGNPLKWVYLTIGMLSAGVMAEAFIPLFGQELAGLTPVAAGFLGAAPSIGWTVAQVCSVGLRTPAARRRAVLTGPVLLAAGLVGYGLLQTEDASPARVLAWAAVLFVAGMGVGSAFPHLSVAAMRSSTDPAEGAKAAAGVSTTQLVANTLAAAVAGILVALGGEDVVAATHWMSFGLAALAASAAVWARVALRRVEL